MDSVQWLVSWQSEFPDDRQHLTAAEMTDFCIDRIDGTDLSSVADVRVEADDTPGDGGTETDGTSGDGEIARVNGGVCQQFYTTVEDDTWPVVIERISEMIHHEDSDDFRSLDGQRRYYKWIFRHFNLGSDKGFERQGGTYFPSPIRKQEQAKLRKRAWPRFTAGLQFPVPSGPQWDGV